MQSEWKEFDPDSPVGFLHLTPHRQGLLDILRVLDESRLELRYYGYESWAVLLDPIISLLDSEIDLYPEEGVTT